MGLSCRPLVLLLELCLAKAHWCKSNVVEKKAEFGWVIDLMFSLEPAQFGGRLG